MENKVRISPFEVSVLALLFTVGSTILVIPAGMTAATKQDAWLSSIISIIICAGIGYFFVMCGKAIGRRNYIEYLEDVYGKIFGKVLGLLYVYFGFINSSTLLSYFGYFTTTQMLTETPIEILHLLLAILVMMVVRAGLEVLARVGELLLPWFFFLFIALVIFLIPEVELERISPLYEAGIKGHLSASFQFVAIAGFPMVVFLMFFPKNVNRPDKSKWNFVIGTSVGATVVGVVIFLCIVVLGASTTARQIYPSYVLAKSVSVFEIIERIESVMAGMWIISIFFKTAIYFYVCVVGLAQVLGTKDYHFLVVPMGILISLFATVVYPNIEYMSHWDSTYWPPYAFVMGIVIPLFTLIIDKIMQRKKR